MNYIEVHELYQKVIENPDLVIIDVRSLEEYHMVRVPQAKRVSIENILLDTSRGIKEILEIINDQEIIYIICLSDRRSFMACHSLAKKGLNNTCFVKGGTQNWIAAGYPVLTGA